MEFKGVVIAYTKIKSKDGNGIKMSIVSDDNKSMFVELGGIEEKEYYEVADSFDVGKVLKVKVKKGEVVIAYG